MARPPLHADSWLTQEEADFLDEKYAEFIVADDAVLDAEESLNALVNAACSGASPGQAVDVFNDGRLKSVDECTIAAGLGHAALRSTRQPDGRKTPRRAVPHDSGEDKVDGRRHPSAAATAGQMKAIERANDRRFAAYPARGHAAMVVNYYVGHLELKKEAQLRIGQVVNVWGDGRRIHYQSSERVVPDRLKVCPVQLVKPNEDA